MSILHADMQKLAAQTASFCILDSNYTKPKLQPSLSLNSVTLTMDSSLWSTKCYLSRSPRYHYMVMSQKYESFFSPQSFNSKNTTQNLQIRSLCY